MKRIYLVILLFTGLVAKGQYFMHMYGDPYPTFGFPTHGINTRNIAYGHLMAGISEQNSFGPPGALVTFTDENGTPFFNNVYTINKNGFLGGASKNFVFEWDHAPNIGVIGLSEEFCLETIFYMPLDQNGNVLGLYEYELDHPITGTIGYVRAIQKITESIDGNFVYVSGLVISTGFGFQDMDFFVLKIEVATGNLIWSNVYDFGHSSADGGSWDEPKDLIESPYTPTGVPELIVVGEYRDMNPTTYDPEGFFFRIDASSGMPIGNVKRYNSPLVTNSTDIFYGITVAQNPAAGGQGFMIAGESCHSASRGTGDPSDMWSLKVDPVGNVLWSYLYASAPGTASDHGRDVIERKNPFTGKFEYYYGGYRIGNAPPDLTVIKTDYIGNVLLDGQIMYDYLENTIGYELDQFNNDGPNLLSGLSIYGFTYGVAYGTGRMLHVKTYFNGFMECNDWRETPSRFSGPGLTGTTSVFSQNNFRQISTLSVTVRPVPDQYICFNPSVPGGSNARVAPAEPKEDKQATIAPNPMAQGTSAAIVELDAPANTEVNVAIYDMVGKEYYNGSFTLEKGKNRLPVDISNANMAAGMYTVKISGQAINKNILLMVK